MANGKQHGNVHFTHEKKPSEITTRWSIHHHFTWKLIKRMKIRSDGSRSLYYGPTGAGKALKLVIPHLSASTWTVLLFFGRILEILVRFISSTLQNLSEASVCHTKKKSIKHTQSPQKWQKPEEKVRKQIVVKSKLIQHIVCVCWGKKEQKHGCW